jgi:hypothetical protein
MKRKTIGETPWDSVVPPKVTVAAPKKETKPTSSGKKTKPSAVPTYLVPAFKARKERLTVHLSVEVIERAKNAVYWSPGLTLAGFTETAFLKALEAIEKANGRPFPHRKAELKGGRPMK